MIVIACITMVIVSSIVVVTSVSMVVVTSVSMVVIARIRMIGITHICSTETTTSYSSAVNTCAGYIGAITISRIRRTKSRASDYVTSNAWTVSTIEGSTVDRATSCVNYTGYTGTIYTWTHTSIAVASTTCYSCTGNTIATWYWYSRKRCRFKYNSTTYISASGYSCSC